MSPRKHFHLEKIAIKIMKRLGVRPVLEISDFFKKKKRFFSSPCFKKSGKKKKKFF